MQDYYKLIGVSENASGDEIKKNLRDSQRKWTYAQNAPMPERRYEAEQNLRLVPEIKRVLLNKRERKKYNQLLSKESTAQEITAPSAAPTSSDDAPSGDVALEEARRLLVQGRIADALAAATMLTMIQSDNADGWFLLAHCHAQMSNSADAVHACERAIQLAPNKADFHFFLGSHYAEDGNWAEALPHMRRAAEADPETPVYRVGVGAALLGTDDGSGSNLEEGMELMDECVIQHPDDNSVRKLVASTYINAAQASWDYLARLDQYVPTTLEQIEKAEWMLEQVDALEVSEDTPLLRETRRTVADSRKRAFDGNWLAVVLVPLFWGMFGSAFSFLYGCLFSCIYGVTSVSTGYKVRARMLKKQDLLEGPFGTVLVYGDILWALVFFIPLRFFAAMLAVLLRVKSEWIDRAFDKLDAWLWKDGRGYKIFQKFSSAVWIWLSSYIPLLPVWKFVQNREEVLSALHDAREIATRAWNKGSKEIKDFKSKDITS